jgi:hypothetical protein
MRIAATDGLEITGLKGKSGFWVRIWKLARIRKLSFVMTLCPHAACNPLRIELDVIAPWRADTSISSWRPGLCVTISSVVFSYSNSQRIDCTGVSEDVNAGYYDAGRYASRSVTYGRSDCLHMHGGMDGHS